MLQDLGPTDLHVVVPVRITLAEHAENLALCLRALLAARPAPGGILVVDDGSPDPWAVPGVLPEGVATLRIDPRGPAAARNAGAALVVGGAVVFVDSDIQVPVDAFSRLVADFASPEAPSAVWGTVTAAQPHADLVSRYKNHTHRHLTHCLEPRSHHLTTMLAAVRVEALRAVGGFDETLATVSVEDVEFGRQLYDHGFVILLDAHLECVHRHRFTLERAVRNDFHKARLMAATTLRRRDRGLPSVQVTGRGERRQVRYLVGVPLGAGAALSLTLGAWPLALLLGAGLGVVERGLLAYLWEQEGPAFVLACLPLMLLERGVVSVALTRGAADYLVERLASSR